MLFQKLYWRDVVSCIDHALQAMRDQTLFGASRACYLGLVHYNLFFFFDPGEAVSLFSEAMPAGFLKLLEVSHPFWEASDLFIYCVSWRFLFGIFILFSFFSILFFLFLFVNARLFFRFMNVFSNSRTLSFKTHKLFSYSSTFIRILELFSTAWIY